MSKHNCDTCKFIHVLVNMQPCKDCLTIEHPDMWQPMPETIVDDLQSRLAAAEQRVKELEKLAEWHKYPDEKPEEGKNVLVYLAATGEKAVCHLFDGDWEISGNDNGDWYMSKAVSHFAYLLDDPHSEKDKE